MRISFGEHSVVLHSWETKEEMIGFLEKCDAGSILLGEGEELPVDFFSVVVHWGGLRLHRFGVGICSEGHGLTPQLLLQPTHNELIIGLNSEVVGVNVVEKTVDFRIGLDSLFYDFLPLNECHLILVLHEIGVIAMTEDGKEIWHYSRDIMEDYFIKEEWIYLKFMDAENVKLCLSSGIVKAE
ncbi:hypothetical protein HYR99_42055 [Candidatus Poribacteria bacterium]|nr:hypothetical protein [Candidatus Poribacteria bacterium]